MLSGRASDASTSRRTADHVSMAGSAARHAERAPAFGAMAAAAARALGLATDQNTGVKKMLVCVDETFVGPDRDPQTRRSPVTLCQSIWSP